MKKYVLVQGRNPQVDKFGPYTEATVPLMDKYGWKRVTVNFPGTYKALEGEVENASILIFEAPSEEAVLALWNSPEYQEAKKLRQGLAEFQVLILDAADT